ncbi:phosphomannomutase/phosphoglucomutase [Paenibacillus sp. JMULE4]|uniref:phosphomannomutase/phosphoglucomutase n=1 Tax=Paenibacillus TaxID=44249 RepID=UPI0006CF60D5|nr:phosphomannomutase/phosphoglucomutase [Paenibacillus sp. JMULE4]NTZ20087.1 phosphomannomutase/phosphoglucomutase [Paenibacillus sp. JMULE4]
MRLIDAKRNLLPTQVFREYDIRGKAYAEIDLSFCYLLGKAFGEKVRATGTDKVIVGRDNRKSSPEFHRALISGLHQASCHVVDIGEVTTPMFYYALEFLKTPCGVMITASHNPGDENGFKIAMDYSTIYGNAILELRQGMRRLSEEEDIPQKYRWNMRLLKREDVEEPYLTMLAEKIKLGPRKLKVVVDCGNGTPSPFVPKALKNWGCEVIELYCKSDPDFPNHHPDPVDPNNLKDLIDKVRASKADIGIAFDGDGDRLGVVDEQGNVLWGDQLMVLFWREILPRYPGCDALIEVKCSKALVEEVERLGGRPVYHRTGHSHIKATMRRLNTPFSGEMSGHLFFRDEYYGFDDALYAAGRLLRILTHTDKRLSDCFKDVPRYYATPETRVPCSDDAKLRILNKVKHYFHGSHETIEVDGIRVLFPGGWGLVRCSNTQPILVLRAEAETEEGLNEIKSELEKALKTASGSLQVNW